MVATLVFLNILLAQEPGLTNAFSGEIKVYDDRTDEVTTTPPAKNDYNKKYSYKSRKDTTEWVLVDSTFFHGVIVPRKKYILQVDGEGYDGFTPMPLETLTTEAENAIQYSPEWLRLPLRDKFRQFDSYTQKKYANMILSVSYPIIDEVAFAFANIGTPLLSHSTFNKDLLIENARLMYKADSLLDYVEIIDYPDSSTTRYTIADSVDTFQITISKDLYYWNIVHPIISDEACMYVNPKNAAFATPPYGKFWRNYLFNYPDTTTYTVVSAAGTDTIIAGTISPILRDQLLGEKVLWKNKRNTTSDNGAVGIITKWIQDVMVFGSGYGGLPRSIQPTRIYFLHQGRCGEHADITGAAGKSCLIPTGSTYVPCNDHTWNEFRDTVWHGWEPSGTLIGDTTYYDTWWSNKMAVAIDYRGDGYLLDVTNRWTYDVCTLTVFIKDSADKPVDGAAITLESTWYADTNHSNIAPGTLHYTDINGIATFVIGNDKPYYLRIDSDIGDYPPEAGYVTQVIDSSVVGQNYYWEYKFDAASMPDIPVTEISPEDSANLYRLDLSFNTPQRIAHGSSFFATDLAGRANGFADFRDTGNIEFFICDEANYALYQDSLSFDAYCVGRNADSGSISFLLPTVGNWYAIFSDEDQLKAGQVLSFNAKLYKDISAIEEVKVKEPKITISPIPSNSYTYINLTLPKTNFVKLEVYDLSGRCVKKLENNFSQGNHQLKLGNKDLQAGVYFIHLSIGEKKISQKIVRL